MNPVDNKITILDVTAATVNGEGPLERTGKEILTRFPSNGKARAYLTVTALGGTSPTADVELVTEVDGQDVSIGSFTQATGVTTEAIVVDACPAELKAKYTLGGTSPSLTAKVTVEQV